MTGFYRRDGDLFAEDVPLRDIARAHGTPAFVYSKAAIACAYEAFDGAFADHPHRICYAVKANSNIGVLSVLAKLGAGFDIVSGGELARVVAAGGSPAKVVFSGVGKQTPEIEEALRAGIACFNIESASEMGLIIHIAGKLGLTAPIAIRVNPDVDPQTHPYIATGLRENKFGVSTDEALALYRLASRTKEVAIRGIACHIGSQITELSPFLEALDQLVKLTGYLEQSGIGLDHIDLGGGIGVRYREETPIDMRTFAAAVLRSMRGRSETLLFEPGRRLVANAGILLTRVNTLKRTGGKHFAVLDAAMNDLIRPALYRAYQEVLKVGDVNLGELTNWDLVGPVCESGDFLAKDRELALTEGDLLAIMSSGAYGFVMSSNYNSRPRAPELLVDGATTHLVRRRETMRDLLALEQLPP